VTQKFETCPGWGAKLKSFILNETLDNTPLAVVSASSARKCKFTHPYPNFLFLDPKGTPSFPPVFFANDQQQTAPTTTTLLGRSSERLVFYARNPRENECCSSFVEAGFYHFTKTPLSPFIGLITWEMRFRFGSARGELDNIENRI
jgi:hypothetical protein